jgi:hypothetical protein
MDRRKTYRDSSGKVIWETVFSGTTLENFIKCAIVKRNGLILFDKTLEPRHCEPELYVDSDYFQAARFSFILWTRLNGKEIIHRPIVLEGYLPAGPYCTAAMKRRLPVRQICVPTQEGQGYNFKKFEVEDPLQFLIHNL